MSLIERNEIVQEVKQLFGVLDVFAFLKSFMWLY